MPRGLSFAEKRFDRLPQLVSNCSFRAEHPAEFAAVQSLYRVRNSVAHAGELSYSGGVTKVDQRIAHAFLVGAQEAVDWLIQL